MKHKSAFLTLGAAALVVGSVFGSATAAQAFEPGSAVASKPTYNAALGRYSWKCVYSGWALGKKDASCDLNDPVLQVSISKHNYTFDGSGYTTATYYAVKVSGETICTEAFAEYAHSSGRDKSQACS